MSSVRFPSQLCFFVSVTLEDDASVGKKRHSNEREKFQNLDFGGPLSAFRIMAQNTLGGELKTGCRESKI